MTHKKYDIVILNEGSKGDCFGSLFFFMISQLKRLHENQGSRDLLMNGVTG